MPASLSIIFDEDGPAFSAFCLHCLPEVVELLLCCGYRYVVSGSKSSTSSDEGCLTSSISR